MNERRDAVIEIMAILMAELMIIAKETNTIGMRHRLEEVWENSIPMTVNQFVRWVGWIVNTRYNIDAEHKELIDQAMTRAVGAIDLEDLRFYLGLDFKNKFYYLFLKKERLDEMYERARNVIENVA